MSLDTGTGRAIDAELEVYQRKYQYEPKYPAWWAEEPATEEKIFTITTSSRLGDEKKLYYIAWSIEAKGAEWVNDMVEKIVVNQSGDKNLGTRFITEVMKVNTTNDGQLTLLQYAQQQSGEDEVERHLRRDRSQRRRRQKIRTLESKTGSQKCWSKTR